MAATPVTTVMSENDLTWHRAHTSPRIRRAWYLAQGDEYAEPIAIFEFSHGFKVMFCGTGQMDTIWPTLAEAALYAAQEA